MLGIAQKYISNYFYKKKLKKFEKKMDRFLSWNWNYRRIFNGKTEIFEKKFDELIDEMNMEYMSAHGIYFKLFGKYQKKWFDEFMQELKDALFVCFLKKLVKIY